jgi:hypothetical protein
MGVRVKSWDPKGNRRILTGRFWRTSGSTQKRLPYLPVTAVGHGRHMITRTVVPLGASYSVGNQLFNHVALSG